MALYRLLNKGAAALLLVIFAGTVIPALAQKDSAQGKRIQIKNANKGYYQKASTRNRLVGEVVFEHEGALMYCDSAWLFSAQNRLRAFSNVKINQGDTLFLTGNYLEYSGNTKLALITGDTVTLTDPKTTLNTDRLLLNRRTNVAYYTTWGHILSEDNVLTSHQGYYGTQSKVFNFKDSVHLINPEYEIESDTLEYDTRSEIAYFLGPSTIISDSSFIYCENGVYNTRTDIAQFEKNAYLYHDNRYMTGDSLYYERAGEYGEAFKNVFIHDTVNESVITGQYAEVKGQKDSAFVTGNPIFSQEEEPGDTLHIHGDSLYVIPDPAFRQKQLLQAFNKVRIYKSDLQGSCDSLTYAKRDSTIRMYVQPVIWNDSSQISGDTIYMEMAHNKPDSLKVFPDAFMISIADSLRTNQVSGRLMLGKFKNNSLKNVFVNGNGQSLYYPEDEDEGGYIGMNRSVSSRIFIKFRDGQLYQIGFLSKPQATLYPINKIPPDRKNIEGYNPRFAERPRQKKDILK